MEILFTKYKDNMIEQWEEKDVKTIATYTAAVRAEEKKYITTNCLHCLCRLFFCVFPIFSAFFLYFSIFFVFSWNDKCTQCMFISKQNMERFELPLDFLLASSCYHKSILQDNIQLNKSASCRKLDGDICEASDSHNYQTFIWSWAYVRWERRGNSDKHSTV